MVLRLFFSGKAIRFLYHRPRTGLVKVRATSRKCLDCWVRVLIFGGHGKCTFHVFCPSPCGSKNQSLLEREQLGIFGRCFPIFTSYYPFQPLLIITTFLSCLLLPTMSLPHCCNSRRCKETTARCLNVSSTRVALSKPNKCILKGSGISAFYLFMSSPLPLTKRSNGWI